MTMMLAQQFYQLPPQAQSDPTFFWIGVAVGVVLFIAIVSAICMAIFPRYNVWSAKKEGEAELARATCEQMIQRAQADGRLHAAEVNKQAAIIEAQAVAAQIECIGKGLTEHGLYLRWQWIKMMEERPESSTIYVPTEANLPILEAGKRS